MNNWTINLKIEIYNMHPMFREDVNFQMTSSKSIQGNFQGELTTIKNEFIQKIESLSSLSQSISVNIFDKAVNIDLDLYESEGSKESMENILGKIYEIDKFEVNQVQPNLIKLRDLKSVVYFSDDTNQFEVTGDEHLEFLQNTELNGKIVYNYDGVEMGAGHAFDSTLIFLETIAAGVLVNEISRLYQNFITRKNKRFNPLIYLNLSETVHQILINDYMVDENNAEIIEAVTNQDTKDLILKIKEGEREFHFVINRENNIIEFNVKE